MTLINIGERREIFVDRAFVERLAGVSLRLHEPALGGIAIRNDMPWEGPANMALAVLNHEGRYLMYYRAMTLMPGDESGSLCVAVSDDGVSWTKPALGLVDHAGRSDTNIVATENGEGFLATPWVDTRPGVPADERVKAIASQPLSGQPHTPYRDPAGAKRLLFWGSADGFRFHSLNPQPDFVSDLPNCFDGGNTMFWSEAEQCYVLYYRCWGPSGRSVARATSDDLLSWSPSVVMTYGGAPGEQLYMNNTSPYVRAPHIYIAPAARFMESRRVITDSQVADIGLKETRGYFFGNDCSDGVLLTTRASSTVYDRTFMETFIRPGLGAENWVSRTNFPVTGILPAGPHQLQTYVSRRYMQDSWHVERLLLRTDGFASVSAPWVGGEMITKPFTATGRALEINYRTGAPGFVRVEVQSPSGAPFPGYTLSECPEIIGDEIERVVAWDQGTDVGCLAGQPVRLRFVMRDADLFGFRFRHRSE